MSQVTQTGIDSLRGIVRHHVRKEGLRPFCARIGVPVGHIRSLAGTRPALSSTVESVAHALGLELFVETSRIAHHSVPSDILEALELTEDCTVVDAIEAIRSLRTSIDVLEMARIIRDAKRELDRLLREVLDRSPEP